MKRILTLCGVLSALLISTHALAQAPDEGAAEPTTTASPAKAIGAKPDIEQDLARFWGTRREVQVVQRRLYGKDGRMEATPYFGIIPNDDFITYWTTGIRGGYHFSEAFTVEGSFAYAIDQETDLATFLEGEGIGLKRADIQEVVSVYYSVNILWAPIYGKISLLGAKLSHFETYVGTGFGLFHTTEFPADNPLGNEKVKPSGSAIFGFRWFLTDMFNVRTEYRQYFFQKFQGGVSIPVELSLGLGVAF